MPHAANTTPGAPDAGKKSLKERAVTELEKYAVISLYLWVLFAVFSLHRQLLQGHGISVWQQGFAIVNALVFGKVILIGEALELGRGNASHALASIVLRKSLIFAVLLVAFHIVEEGIRAWFKGEPFSGGVADFGGTLPGLLSYAGIFFVSLIPFFGFQEVARVLGSGPLWNLFARGGEKRFRLVED